MDAITTSPATAVPTLRPATAADLPAVLALLEAHRLPGDGVREALPGFIVAEDGGALVGVIGLETYEGGFGLLRSAAVSDAWRSRGLGRTLVQHLIADATAKGFRAVYLLTTTAEGFFPKFGFTRTTRADVPVSVKGSVEFMSLCPDSATVMALRLDAPATGVIS